MAFKKIKMASLTVIFAVSFLISSCATAPQVNDQSSRFLASDETAIESAQPLLKTLPQITKDNGELLKELKKAIKNRTKGQTDAQLTAAAEKFRDYLFFLGLSARDLKKAELTSKEEVAAEAEKPSVLKVDADASEELSSDSGDSGGEEEDKTPSSLRAILRLFIASTQFLDCPKMTDWECLEKVPSFKPTADFRVEKSDLSTPVNAGKSLDMDVFFTEGWDGSARAGVADQFAKRINSDAEKSLSLAMYGIDDIKDSMSGVYRAILDRAQSNETSVRAVVDVMGFERGEGPWVLSYTDHPGIGDKSVFGASKNQETPDGMRMTFQYNGTPSFLRELNSGITSEEGARARIEWGTAHIMHNKFAVMENAKGERSVWSGTANISKNCMGVEANANMSIYIRNSQIADAFLDEFNLMFNFDKSLQVKSKLVVSPPDEQSLVGRFHRAKYPVSKRLFTFDDGTKVRVHFAPTDDAEHRVILPMLLSAKKGDEIRISMFGGTGYEIIRAMQYAVAKGANVRIAFDRRLGHGLTSWIRDAILNVNMPNPYIGKFENVGVTPGKISVRVSTWTGKNHYKVGSLTRKLANGKWHAEQIIVGSQNWSSGGNDANDENLISIQNLKTDVKAAAMFNKEFDERLWVKSVEERRR